MISRMRLLEVSDALSFQSLLYFRIGVLRRPEQIMCVITSLENNLNSNSCMIQASTLKKY